MSLLLDGLAASSGIAIAPAYLLVGPDLSIKKQHIADKNHEVARLRDSFALTTKELQAIRQRAHQDLGHQAVAVVDAQLAMVNDPVLLTTIERLIDKHSYTAEWGVKLATDNYLALFERNNDDYLNSRILAVRDVYKRVPWITGQSW